MSEYAGTQSEVFEAALLEHQSGNLAAAKRSYQALLQSDTKNPDCYHLLGLIAYQEGVYQDAQRLIEQAIAARTGVADYWSNYGLVLQASCIYEEAIAAFEQALALQPNHQNALYNLASTYLKTTDLEKAEAVFQALLQKYPQHYKGLNNYGTLLKARNQFEEALGCFLKAVSICPEYKEAQWNASMAAFLLGDYPLAWQYFHARWVQVGVAEPRDYPYPTWQGESVEGKSLLIWGEQGIGDQVMFAQALLDFNDHQGDIWVEVEPRLVTLFQRSFPNFRIIPKTKVPQPEITNRTFNWQISMGDLVALKRAKGNNAFPCHQGYLLADSERASAFKLPEETIKIGLSWHTNNTLTGRERSISLEALQPLLALDGISWINLQYGNHKQQIDALPPGIKNRWVDAPVDPLGDLDAFCSLIMACDWVISIDNSSAHLASALGKDTFLLLPFSPDWRWQTQGDTSIWYPKTQLIRQSVSDNWSNEINELHSNFKRLVS